MRAIMLLTLLAILALQLPTLTFSSGIPTDVIVLNDSNFEHHTQASTGQTTGIWCILFSSPKTSDGHQAAVKLWEVLASDEDKEVIYAMIDLDANKQTARRFKGIEVPAAVLLRDRAMYTYTIPNEDDAKDIIFGFVSGGYSMLARQAVPSPGGSGMLGSLKQPVSQEGGCAAPVAGASEGCNAAQDVDAAEADPNVQKLKIAFSVLAIAIVWKVVLYFSAKPAVHQQPGDTSRARPKTAKMQAKEQEDSAPAAESKKQTSKISSAASQGKAADKSAGSRKKGATKPAKDE